MAPQTAKLVNPLCQQGDHRLCAHKTGASAHLISRKREPKALLGACECHSNCPVGGQADVPDRQWFAECTCPGSDGMRDIDVRVRRETEERKTRDAEVLQDLNIRPGQTAGEIQQQLVAAYQTHGYEPPSDFSRWSRFIAAGNGRRGTRAFRLIVEGVSGLRAARRWTPKPTAAEPVARATELADDDEDAQNRSELRKLGRATAAYGLVATAAALGAYFARGIPSIALAVVAALFAAITAWMVLWYAGISILIRISRNAERSR